MSNSVPAGFGVGQPAAPAGQGLFAGSVDPAIARRVANILSVHLVLVVLTQKMALPVGGGIQIAFAMVFQYVVFAMFLLMGVLRVHLMRSLLLLAFVGFATI